MKVIRRVLNLNMEEKTLQILLKRRYTLSKNN
jgi:hypothetical protein